MLAEAKKENQPGQAAGSEKEERDERLSQRYYTTPAPSRHIDGFRL
jgi:hypothetical protein